MTHVPSSRNSCLDSLTAVPTSGLFRRLGPRERLLDPLPGRRALVCVSCENPKFSRESTRVLQIKKILTVYFYLKIRRSVGLTWYVPFFSGRDCVSGAGRPSFRWEDSSSRRPR